MRDLVQTQIDQLTNRELQTLLLITEGLSTREVAARLEVGLATAKTHVANVLIKLDVDSRLKAAIFALNHKLPDKYGGMI